MKLDFIKTRNIWLSFSAALMIASVAAYLFWGLKVGIDFTGGTLMEIQFAGTRPSNAEVQAKLQPIVGEMELQPEGDQGLLMRFRNIDEATHTKVTDTLNQNFGGGATTGAATPAANTNANAPINSNTNTGTAAVPSPTANPIKIVSPTNVNGTVTVNAPVTPAAPVSGVKELQFETVGPVVGQELKSKAVLSIFFVLAVIIIYVALAFRKVSWPVQSWKYGTIAVVALFHDVIGVIGLFAFLGHFYNQEVNAPFVAALLTVLGYSVSDTIIVFDRIRENLAKHANYTFAELVNRSLVETLARSINTVVTVLISLFAVYFFGGESVKSFALALLWGITSGAYSSIFVACPLLVVWYNWDHHRRGRPTTN